MQIRKIIFVLILISFSILQAQEHKHTPQIVVTGEGKVKVIPDNVVINFGIENKGKDASEVKKMNDVTVDKVIKFIKMFGINANDFQTTNVSLYRNYDQEKEKYNYVASQNISITLKDISKYDELMIGLVDNGINNISNVEFKSSKIETYKSLARVEAMKEAKKKAEDYVSVLNQKVGKALLITDNVTNNFYNQQPLYRSAMMTMADSNVPARETLAVGEIEILTNVSVTFLLE